MMVNGFPFVMLVQSTVREEVRRGIILSEYLCLTGLIKLMKPERESGMAGI